MFGREDGRPIHPQRLGDLFERAVRRAGLPPLTLHGLRHSDATNMLLAGVPTKVVQERLGHASLAITSDLYQHVLEGMQADAAEQTAAMVKASRAAPPVPTDRGDGR